MKKYILLTVGAILVALMNLGLSFVGGLNLVWVVVVVLALIELEDDAIVFALISGAFFDLFMHSNIGTTTLAILIPTGVLVLVRFVGLGARLWQKIVLIFLLLFVALLMSSLFN